MKVIGISDSGYILDCSADEMANMLGMFSRYSEGYQKPKVNDEICLDKIYRKIMACESVTKNAGEIKRLTENIIRATEKIDIVISADDSVGVD